MFFDNHTHIDEKRKMYAYSYMANVWAVWIISILCDSSSFNNQHTISVPFAIYIYIYVYGNDEFALLCVNGMCTVHVCLYTQTHCVQWNPTALWHELIFGLNTMRL